MKKSLCVLLSIALAAVLTVGTAAAPSPEDATLVKSADIVTESGSEDTPVAVVVSTGKTVTVSDIQLVVEEIPATNSTAKKAVEAIKSQASLTETLSKAEVPAESSTNPAVVKPAEIKSPVIIASKEVNLKDMATKQKVQIAAGSTLKVTFEVSGVTPETKGTIMNYVENEWKNCPTVCGDNTMTGEFDHFSPVIFVVDGETADAIEQVYGGFDPSVDPKSPQTGSVNLTYVYALSGIALVGAAVLFAVSKEKLLAR